MKIKNKLKKVRFILLQYNFIVNITLAGIIGSILFTILILLESIFYFTSSTKIFILTVIIVCILYIVSFGVSYFYRSVKNRVKKYKFENLSLHLGENLFPEKSDTILNALQLESGAKNNESWSLAQTYINKIGKHLTSIDKSLLINKSKMIYLKRILLTTLLIIIFIFHSRYELSADSFYRWTHPIKEFPAPKPFTLHSLTGDIHILGGEKTEINIKSDPIISDTVNLYLIPCQVSTQKRDSLKLKFSSPPSVNGEYNFKLPELYQDYSYKAIVDAKFFWEAWDFVATPSDTIFVTDRPAFEKFLMTIIPPKYSKIDQYTQAGNIAAISGLKGSLIQIEITSNRTLNAAYLNINDNRLEMASNKKQASGYFKLLNEGELTIHLVDTRGITNRDPIPYSLEIIPDHKPSLSVIKPEPKIELGNEQIIPIQLDIMDDYGFSNLQLAYEIRRPSYLEDDPFVSMFTITDLDPDSIIQTIQILWELSDMLLMPEDEVHFHFELTDNDNISGPKMTVSNTFLARVPSLADLYEKVENSEENFIDDLVDGVDDIINMKEKFDALELEMLKTTELDWSQKQSIKNSLEEARREIEKLEEMEDIIDSITDQAEKHDLFSPSLLEKFKDLSDLISDIIPQEMLNNINDLQLALDDLDLKSIQEALGNLSENLEQVEKDLDRYLEIFKRLQAEQKLDEIQNRMSQLFEQKKSLNDKVSALENNVDPSTLERYSQEEQRNLDEFKNILSLMDEASDLVKPFSESSSEEIAELINSGLTKKIENNLEQSMQSLSNQEIDNAQISSHSSLEDLEIFMQQMINLEQNFQQETISEMTEKFQALMQDILYLSSQEEQLKSEVNQSSRNSPRLREFAGRQQLLQDQLQSIANEMIKLSNETFAITPDIGRGIGKTNAGMQEAKIKLTERNLNKAGKSQDLAMEGLNETALSLYNSIKDIQKSGSASGFQQFLEMMQQMVGKQQGVNQQGMQLGLGQMAAAQQQMMKQMLKDQKDIRKSLEQLMNEMRHSNQKGIGELGGITKEMDEVIKDLQKKQFNRKTQERQQRILSRMLDSQTSLTQRGQKEERKSTSALSTKTFEGPSGLPADLGQRESIALRALNNAMNAGYAREYQAMIKHYFNSLSKKPDKEYFEK